MFYCIYMCIGLCAGSFLLFGALIEFLFYSYRMPPRKEKATPKKKSKTQANPTSRQQAAARARAERATRAAQRAEVQESIHEVDQNFEDDAADAPAGMPTGVEPQMPGVEIGRAHV